MKKPCLNYLIRSLKIKAKKEIEKKDILEIMSLFAKAQKSIDSKDSESSLHITSLRTAIGSIRIPEECSENDKKIFNNLFQNFENLATLLESELKNSDLKPEKKAESFAEKTKRLKHELENINRENKLLVEEEAKAKKDPIAALNYLFD